MWGINPFDQWGVELGTVMASQLSPKLLNDDPHAYDSDSSTNALTRLLRQELGRPA